MTIDDALAAAGGDSEPVSGGVGWSAANLPWRLVETAMAGALAGVLIIFFWLELRPDLPLAASGAFFWIKGGYPLAIAACALVAATRLAREQRGADVALGAAAVLGGLMLVAAAVQIIDLPTEMVLALLWPDGAICVANVLTIAAPMLLLAAVGLRRVELDRPAATGFACGLFCGGVAGAVDGLHCWQETYAFVGPWFSLAMLACGAVGAGSLAMLARWGRLGA
ncbi:DUF1109 domain-containing protein [Caulobacter sp. RHG1]|uniref:DUF1109 domain-containing protein n=1 Tax=Caulobacter sp. (strain RHG1) TaxID=2545762 RepID=UPI001554D1FD|nr:hypothetical protein [Caulobacter sp. RHG1]